MPTAMHQHGRDSGTGHGGAGAGGMRQHGGEGAAAHPHSSGEDSSSSDDEDDHDFLPTELDGRDSTDDSARACDGDEPIACGICDGAAPLALPTPVPVRRTRRTDAMLSFWEDLRKRVTLGNRDV